MELHHYTEPFKVMNSDGDFRRLLKPSALFRYIEQAAGDHARAYGMDDDFFHDHSTAFLIGKQAVQISRMPRRAEMLTLDTRCERFKRGTMKRLTTVYDAAGKPIIEVDARWIAADTNEGRILREPSWSTPEFWNEDLEGGLPQLVHKTKDLTSAGSWKASYSLCDLNGHVNNAAYLDIACDALPPEVIESGPVRFICIKYHRQVMMGQTVDVSYAQVDDGWYIVGRGGEHMAFECYLAFDEAEKAE